MSLAAFVMPRQECLTHHNYPISSLYLGINKHQSFSGSCSDNKKTERSMVDERFHWKWRNKAKWGEEEDEEKNNHDKFMRN